jgi:hypothetical protein
MVTSGTPNWLCKLGLHKWEDYGESVMLTRKEPMTYVWPTWAHRKWRRWRGTPKKFLGKKVRTKRKCLRCGINMKRILAKNLDGTLSSVGWVLLSKFDEETYEESQRETARRKMIR